MRRMMVAVIGAAQPSSEDMRLAERVGALLVTRGWVVLSGGLGGVMEAASRGAAGGGGTVVGILPTGQPDDCNCHVDIAIATGLGDARNAIIANSADGFIAVGGSFGTLSEIAFALKRNKPVVALGSWQLDESRLSGTEPFVEASTPEEAVSMLDEMLGEGGE